MCLYQILKCVGKVAYELDLPSELASVHPEFHVSLMRRCVSDSSSIVPLKNVGIKECSTHDEVPLEILDWQVQKLRNKKVACIKVLWRNQEVTALLGRPKRT